MDMETAVSIMGLHARRPYVVLMCRALSLHPWNNTPEERDRLEAGRYILCRWPAYLAFTQY
jgi:hypothetical protein